MLIFGSILRLFIIKWKYTSIFGEIKRFWKYTSIFNYWKQTKGAFLLAMLHSLNVLHNPTSSG